MPGPLFPQPTRRIPRRAIYIVKRFIHATAMPDAAALAVKQSSVACQMLKPASTPWQWTLNNLEYRTRRVRKAGRRPMVARRTGPADLGEIALPKSL
jgi:hypothetical protein